jgi:hypothetical protein
MERSALLQSRAAATKSHRAAPEGALDIMLCSEKRVAVAVDSFSPTLFMNFEVSYWTTSSLTLAVPRPTIPSVSAAE